MKNRFSLLFGTMLVTVLLVGAGCSQTTETTEDTTTPEPAGAVTSTVTVGGDEDTTEETTSETTVTTVGNTFSPSELTISAGDSVTFDLGASHNVVEVSKETYEAQGKTALEGGFSVDFGGNETVTFDEAGTYYYVCEPHAGMGMVGMITVE